MMTRDTRFSRVLGQAGDTLVEVTLAMAILGVLLGGTYAISRRGLRVGQVTQEHIEALKILEGQAERLRAVKISGGVLPTTTFCFLSGQSTAETADMSKCNLGQDGRYAIRGTYTAVTASSPPLYTFVATWTGPGDTGSNERVEYKYRLW